LVSILPFRTAFLISGIFVVGGRAKIKISNHRIEKLLNCNDYLAVFLLFLLKEMTRTTAKHR